MLELFLITLVALCSLVCFIVLIVIGYREQLKQVTGAANRNAGYWAESEAKLSIAVTELARAEGVNQAQREHANAMTKIAYEALVVARGKVFEPKSEPELREMPWNEMQEYLRQAESRGIEIDEWPEVFD